MSLQISTLSLKMILMSKARHYHVYMLASKSRTLYVGITGSLMARVLRHRSGEGSAFTRKYRANRLVWYQSFESVGHAIARETEIKAWRREKKVALIIVSNPTWEDQAADWGKQVSIEYVPLTWEKQVPHR
jgi:putative endonuclease